MDAAVFEVFHQLERVITKKDEAEIKRLIELLDDFDNRCDQVQLYCVCII